MLTGISQLLALLLTFYLILGEPIFGSLLYRRFLKKVAKNRAARKQQYLLWIGQEWIWVLVIIFIIFLSSVPLSMLGLQPPQDWTITLLVSICLLPSMVIASILLIRQIKKTARAGPAQSLLETKEMLPHTSGERLLFLLLSFTAGICEEVTFRGFLSWSLLQIVRFLGGQWPLWAGLILSTIIFGLAHCYQGWKGVLRTGYTGGVFAILYIWTGSLLLPILCHILIDSRNIFVAPAVLRLAQTTEKDD